MTLVQQIVRNSLVRTGYKTTNHYPQSAWFTEYARANQLPPDGTWSIWLLLAGRGFGKTRTICEYAIEQARCSPGSRGAIVGATASDARDVLVGGESGILAISQDTFRPIYNPSQRKITWPNGSIALLFSADEPKRLRGPQHHWAIADELAAWRRPEAWDMLLMGTRLGDDPRIAVATTPKPIKLIKKLLTDTTCHVTHGTTYENRENLAPKWFDDILRRYENTRLGRQELEAAILDDALGALWTRANLDETRVAEFPALRRIVVALDPAVTANEESNETGIIIAGTTSNGHGYVLDDMTVKASPAGWAKQAITAYHKYHCDRMIAEVNNGGDMIEHTIRTVRDIDDKAIGRDVSFKQVRASRGKHTRAEPVAALYEQGRIHHVGTFGDLEDQMCQWIPGDESPDRLDALVWALTELMLTARSFISHDPSDDV